jgi:2-oxoglutarate ferredoxin oxidoreductase subunit beta
MDAPKLVKLTKKDLETDQDVRWCPGCGDYAILATVQRTLATLGIKRENTVFVSGIGCSSRFPYYMNTFGFHTIHGRAPAIATGLKLARPELDVWVITGDGDGLSIGGNHMLHALRRNVGLKVILFNNQIYGLTKGQYSPTSKVGTRAASTPSGSIDHPLNPLQFAIGAGATFIARTTDTDAKGLAAILDRAYKHQGSALIEILQNCPVFNDGVWDQVKDDAANHQLPLVEASRSCSPAAQAASGCRATWCREIVNVGEGGVAPEALLVHCERGSSAYAHLISSLTHPDFPVPVGVLHSHEKATFDSMAHQQVADAIAKQGKGELGKLMLQGMTWEVGVDGIRA